MQVAVEIRVEPRPRAHRTPVFCRYTGRNRNSPVAKNPARSAVFNRCFEEWIPGEPAPRFQLASNARFVTDHRDQISRAAAAQHSDQLRQEAGCESLSPDFQIDVSPHWDARILESRVRDLLRGHPLIRAGQLD